MPDLVSVVIPTHNYAHFLGDAIESALSSGFEPIEIIVVDDGSTDQTPAVLERYERRVHTLRLEGLGVARARNAGLDRASGEYVVFLDADDLLVPGGITAQVGAMRRRPQVDAVYGPWYTCDVRTGVAALVVSPIRPSSVYPQILLTNVVTPPTAMMVRRRALQDEGGFNPALSFAADWDLWIRLARHGCGFDAVPHPVAIYRLHDRSMTGDLVRAARDTWDVLDRHFADASLPGEVAALRAQAYFRRNEYLGKLHLERGDDAGGMRLLRSALSYAPEAAQSAAFYDSIAKAVWRRWQVEGRPRIADAMQAMVDLATRLEPVDGSPGSSRRAAIHLGAGLAARRLGAQRVALRHLGAALRASWPAVMRRHFSTAARLVAPPRVFATVKASLTRARSGASARDAAWPLVARMLASSQGESPGIVVQSHGRGRP